MGKNVLLFSFLLLFSKNTFALESKSTISEKAIPVFESICIDKMAATEHGVFLLVNDIWMMFEEVQATADGIIVLQDGNWISLVEASYSNVTDCGIDREKTWKCPYCYFWWPLGQKCGNPECPTNKW